MFDNGEIGLVHCNLAGRIRPTSREQNRRSRPQWW